MNYKLIHPPEPLRRYVRSFWTLESPTDDGTEKTFTVMSNGAPGLIFQQNPEAFTGFEGERLPQLFVFGQARQYGQLQVSGSFRTIGVNFQPMALKSVFGINANELTDQNTAISNLTRVSLREELLNSSSIEQQLASLSTFLLAQTNHHEDGNKKLNYAVAALAQGKGLSELLQELGRSERWLERLFLAHIGITPKLYARISRFQSALGLLRQGRPRSLTDIAHSLGYFDQSHFIRDFKLFSGVSPGIYVREAIERMPGFPEWNAEPRP
jgi:AraC-like DNA-binding protein